MKTQAESEIKELEELVELAEAVSGNIEEIENKRTHVSFLIIVYIFIFIFAFSVVALYFEAQSSEFKNEYRLYGIYFSFFAGIIFFTLLYRVAASRTKMLNTVERERDILMGLLEMIHSYKEIAYQDMSVVKKAIIDMRLNRIKFGA